jgi:hypothetical protein
MNRLEYSVMSPSGDKERPNDPSTERILCQALNVVSTEQSSYGLTDEVNLKKIAKKRRGASGTVDVEYTKSSKEYLQKAQQSLRQDASYASTNSSTEFSLSSTTNPYGYEDPDATTTTNQSSSNLYGYEDPDTAPVNRCGPSHRSLSQPTIQSSSNPYGYGDPDPSPSKQYGYEDPDAAPTIRRRGLARRRGSVTKFSVQIAADANAATDRILKKTNVLHKKEVFSSPEPTLPVNGERSPRRSAGLGLLSTSRGRFGRMSMDAVPPKANIEKCPGSDIKPITPKRQPSLRGFQRTVHAAASTPPQSRKKPLSAGALKVEDYGYGDQDAKSSSDSDTGAPERMEIAQHTASTSANPYGYGESAAPEQPRRRESVTKFSLEAQAKVITSEPMKSEPVYSTVGPYKEIPLNDESERMEIAQPTASTSANPYGYGESAAPEQPRRRESVTKFSLEAQAKVITSEPVKSEPVYSTVGPYKEIPLNDEPLLSSTLGPETVTPLNDVTGTDSRWSLIVPDQACGHKAPQRTSSNHSFKKNYLSPKRSGSMRSIARAAARLRRETENSMHESMGSNSSWDSAKPPGGSTSWRRTCARSNSIGSIGSDCDSLASDMISLCSISVRNDDRQGAPSPAASFKKSIVSRTPSNLEAQNSDGSLLGVRSTAMQADDEDDGSVAAMKAFNLEDAKKSYGVPSAINSNRPVCRSYSGERLRVLRDQQLLRDQQFLRDQH